MKTSVLISLICFPLLLSCGERKAEHAEVATRQAVVESSAPQNTPSSDSSVAKGKATKLAMKVAKSHLGPLEKYDIITSGVDDGWHVTFYLKDKSPARIGGGMDFFIDKEGDKITDVKLYQ
jgi:hypothetical protein